jgi:predicted nucleic acid-binding protein
MIVDADVVIGFLDASDAHHERAVAELGDAIRAGGPLAIAATAYSEVHVAPRRAGCGTIVDRFLDDARIEVVAIDRSLARAVGELRALHRGLRVPDACTLAVARGRGEPLLTFDASLARLAR